MDTHAITCDITETQCDPVQGVRYWYAPDYRSGRTGCCHCKGSCTETSETCSYSDHNKYEEDDPMCVDGKQKYDGLKMMLDEKKKGC
jgi:hypothetical protein